MPKIKTHSGAKSDSSFLRMERSSAPTPINPIS